MDHRITLTARSGLGDGYRADLPLDRELTAPVTVDASALRACHPMFAIRMPLFVDWHADVGHEVRLAPPINRETNQRLADLGLYAGLEPALIDGPVPEPVTRPETLLPIRRITTFHDVEDAAEEMLALLHAQARDLAGWGDATHTTLGELGDNALQHGDASWAYIAADRTDQPRRCVRLAIVDLGIGIPDHIRNRHPEWADDVAAITRVLDRGVTGTDDPHRGNGYAEVLDKSTQDHLVRAGSAATLDIRSSRGHVSVEVVGGHVKPEGRPLRTHRRGTWLTYTVVSA